VHPIIFSKLAHELTATTNRLYSLNHSLKAQGKQVVDLVSGNLSSYGTLYPADALQEILSGALQEARIYRPDSFGQKVAREAIAQSYKAMDETLDLRSEQILLTPGTSMSYWYCFKMLAEEGDEILCPRPSYPLFDYIAKISGVKLAYYDLIESQDWQIDLHNLEKQINPRTRAIVLISPHNPTGSVINEEQIEKLGELLMRHELPVISDEVFSEFLFEREQLAQKHLPRIASSKAPLVFTLNGLSKNYALPGIKIGWIIVTGRKMLVQNSLRTLEMISDTFLPVNEIAQFAAAEIIKRGASFINEQIKFVSECREKALASLADLSFVRPQGGFYITLPVRGDEEEIAFELLEKEQILVHPGYFYEMDGNHLVMSFIYDPKEIGAAFSCIRRIGLGHG
jgi:alanine-synthesizing transaminase